MVDNDPKQFQRQALEMLRAQQDAYLEAVRAWQKTVATGTAGPQWPEPPPLDTLPNPTEFAEVSAEFAARLLEEQSRFMKQLSETLASANKNR